ncbi:MAG: metallophosphoesterase [Desulfovibrionales bacterium]|nr:metallophosphoesterase [Desulfovibrionales bacterium]
MALVCRILHLSDLHYGVLNKKFKHRFRNFEFVRKCAKAVNDYCNKSEEQKVPLYIVITGDLVCKGEIKKQHTRARENLSKLYTALEKKYPVDIFLVPGNHDVNRKAVEEGQDPLAYYVTEVNNHFCRTKIERELTTKFGLKNFRKERGQKWIHTVKPRRDLNLDSDLAFITFYSPITDKKLLKNPYTGSLLDGEDCWLYDRGLIDNGQWKDVKREIKKLGNNKNLLKIAICHHNPLPLRRYYKKPRTANEYTEIDAFSNPEVNLLANGPELLTLLTEQGVNLLLHGHRHQDAIAESFPKKKLVIIGAPSAGLSDEGLMEKLGKNNTELTPPKWQGFNVLDIYKNELGFSINVNTFSFDGNEKKYILAEGKDSNETKLIPLYSEPIFPFEPLSESEGVKSAIEHLTQSKHGTTSLHYTYEAVWDDKPVSRKSDQLKITLSSKNTPLYHLLKGIKNNGEIATHFTKYLAGKNGFTQDRIEELRYQVTESIVRGFIVPALKSDIQDENNKGSITWNHLTANPEAPEKNLFYKALIEIGKKGDRNAIYALELMKLLDNKNYILRRCVYFWPISEDRRKGGVTLDNLRQFTAKKFLWLLNTLLAYRGLENAHIAWLPLAFEGCDGQTILCMEPPDMRQKTTPSVLLGFGEDLDAKREDRISVYKVTAVPGNNAVGNKLGENLRGMLTHIVHPLARRLMEAFPLMREGKICCRNVQNLILVFGLTDDLKGALKTFKREIETYDSRFKSNEEDEEGTLAFNSEGRNNWAIRLKELYEWKYWNIEKTTNDSVLQKGRPPWNEHDYKWLKERLENSGY